MAQRLVATVGLAIVIVAVLVTNASASFKCMKPLMSMMPCLSYTAGDASTPSPSCCSAFSNVLKNQPECLCEIANGGGSNFGVKFNQTKALGVPRTCKIDAPPASECNKANPSKPNTVKITDQKSPEVILEKMPPNADVVTASAPHEEKTPSSNSGSGSMIMKSSMITLVVTVLASFNVLFKH